MIPHPTFLPVNQRTWESGLKKYPAQSFDTNDEPPARRHTTPWLSQTAVLSRNEHPLYVFRTFEPSNLLKTQGHSITAPRLTPEINSDIVLGSRF
jgi:hypothetical protein